MIITVQYCPTGTLSPTLCPAGYFCPTPAQRFLCPHHYFCPEGSISPKSILFYSHFFKIFTYYELLMCDVGINND